MQLHVPALAQATPANLAQADALPNPLPQRRGGSAPNLPLIEPAPPPPPSIPSAPVRPPVRETKPPGGVAFVLRGIRVTGTSVLSQADVNSVAAPYLNRPVDFQDLEEIRQKLTRLYVDRGFINSGVIIPDQTINDGILRLQVIEGRLIEIDLTGNRYYRTSYLTDRLWRGVSTPFNVNDLARQQQILLEDPFLSRLNLNILPGLTPGEARLTGEVTELRPYSLTAQIADDQSPTVGEVRGQLQGIVGNLLGVGDVLALQYGRSLGLNDGAVSYSVPVSSDDTRLSLRYDINSTLAISNGLGPLNITSQYQGIGVGLSRPFYRTPEQNLTLGLSLEWRQSRTFLLNEPFSFVPGSDNGRTNVTALRFYQSWLDQNAQRVLALRSTFSLGINALGATVTDTKPTGQFFVWLGQAQYVRRLFQDWELLTRASLQLSHDPLFPIEQFVLGGFSTLRGYREYLEASDNAFVGTVELHVPVGRVPLPWLSTSETAGIVQLVPFYDHGAAWNTGRPTPARPAPAFPNLSDIGLGVRWLIGSGLVAELYYGHALRRVNVGNSLEDKGVYFRITASLF